MIWGEYLVLFGTSEENVQLLNQAASSFAGMIQDALWERVLLHLCRLVDSVETSGKKNLTVRRLPLLVDDALKQSVEQAIAKLSDDCTFARDWRNRLISHADLDLSLGTSSKPLAPASRACVRQALQGLCKILNVVEHHYRNSTVLFDHIEPICGCKSLLYVLKKGLKADADSQERLLRGCPLPGDYE
jgi:hypothetical protein